MTKNEKTSKTTRAKADKAEDDKKLKNVKKTKTIKTSSLKDDDGKKTKCKKTSNTTKTKRPGATSVKKATRKTANATNVVQDVDASSPLTDKQKRLVAAFKATMGNVLQACKAARVDRSSFYRWRDESPEFRNEIEALKVDDAIIDLAEQKLLEKIKAGSWAAIQFVLETKGQPRGWSKTTNVAVSGPPQVVVQEADVAFFAAGMIGGENGENGAKFPLKEGNRPLLGVEQGEN